MTRPGAGGYPCRWLVAVLNQRGVKFCMRVVKSEAGFACVRDFARSDALERVVMLRAPDKQDAIDYECPRKPQRVRWSGMPRRMASSAS